MVLFVVGIGVAPVISLYPTIRDRMAQQRRLR
jgi:hypothetical protein